MEREAVIDTATATDTGPSRFRLRWDSQGLVLEERRSETGAYEQRADSGLDVPPTPFAVTHPELQALLEETVRGFHDDHLGESGTLDIALSPPWGNAWLLDVGNLPEEEIEDQVAWELQQRLDSPLDDHIYAWHPVGDSVYAVVVRPELLQFWDELAEETGVDLGRITLISGTVSPDIEQEADLLPLYRLWRQRQESAPQSARATPEGGFSLFEGDEELEEDLDTDRDIRAVEYEEADEEEADEYLSAIIDEDRAARRRKRRSRAVVLVLLALLLLLGGLAGGYALRDRIPASIRDRIEDVVPEPVERFADRITNLARRQYRALMATVKGRDARPATTPAQPAPGHRTTEPDPSRLERERATAGGGGDRTARQSPVRETPQQAESRFPQDTQRTEQRQPSAPVTSRTPVVTVGLHFVEPPPVIPTAGGVLVSLLEQADVAGVHIDAMVLQEDRLHMSVAGESGSLTAWGREVANEPGAGRLVVAEPVPGTGSLPAAMDLNTPDEEEMTRQQFEDMALALGIERYGSDAFSTDRAGLIRMLGVLDSEHRRPFRLSIHAQPSDRYHLVMFP